MNKSVRGSILLFRYTVLNCYDRSIYYKDAARIAHEWVRGGRSFEVETKKAQPAEAVLIYLLVKDS